MERSEPGCGNIEPMEGHELDQQRGRVTQSPAAHVLPWAGLGERDAACRRRAAGAVHDRWRGGLPPVEDCIRQLLGDGQQRVVPTGWWLVESAGIDAVVELEDVEVGLVGQVQCGGWAVQLDEVQGCGVGADPARRESLSGGCDGVVGRVADPEAARGWVEPMARDGEPVPGPRVM